MFTVAILTAAGPVAAQSLSEGDEASAAVQPSGNPSWPVYPSERHVLIRGEATAGLRASDPFSLGALTPVSAFVEGTYAFLKVGSFLFGPSLGIQAGFSPAGGQYTLQPGVAGYRRFSPTFAMTARIDVPILLTAGDCGTLGLQPSGSNMGSGISDNVNFVHVPNTGYCPTTSVGIEAAVGAAYYLRAGLALTGEITFDYYVGDGMLGYPIVGLGLGVLFDYEVLP